MAVLAGFVISIGNIKLLFYGFPFKLCITSLLDSHNTYPFNSSNGKCCMASALQWQK